MMRNSAKSQRKDNQSLLTKHFTFPSRLFVQPYNPPKNTQVRWRTQADSLISLNTLFRWHAALLYILYISIFWGEREKVWNSLLVIPPTSLRPPPPPKFSAPAILSSSSDIKYTWWKICRDKGPRLPPFLFLTGLIQRLVLVMGSWARKGPSTVQEGHGQRFTTGGRGALFLKIYELIFGNVWKPYKISKKFDPQLPS